MTLRRITYGVVLLTALLCQIFDTGYLVHFVFILVLCLPLAGLALSLPAMVLCRLRLTPRSGQVRRGERAVWDLTLESSLPLPRLTCRLRVRNVMTGQRWSFRLTERGFTASHRLTRTLVMPRCGLLECRLERPWVCDCLGLFALPVKAPPPVTLLVCPHPLDPGPLHIPEEGVPVGVPRGSAGLGEDYDLRPYRPGDSVRTIHWKLSAKRDETVVRELLATRRPLPVLTFDHFGTAEELEGALDRLWGLSEALLGEERHHEVRWAEPESGVERRFSVEDQHSRHTCLTAILRDRASAAGRSILERPLSGRQEALLYHIHVTREEARHERG